MGTKLFTFSEHMPRQMCGARGEKLHLRLIAFARTHQIQAAHVPTFQEPFSEALISTPQRPFPNFPKRLKTIYLSAPLTGFPLNRKKKKKKNIKPAERNSLNFTLSNLQTYAPTSPNDGDLALVQVNCSRTIRSCPAEFNMPPCLSC